MPLACRSVALLPKEEQGTLKIRIGMQSTASLPTLDEVRRPRHAWALVKCTCYNAHVLTSCQGKSKKKKHKKNKHKHKHTDRESESSAEE